MLVLWAVLCYRKLRLSLNSFGLDVIGILHEEVRGVTRTHNLITTYIAYTITLRRIRLSCT